jgi:hypothetical protein
MKYQFKDTMITSEEDLEGLSGPELVELYNDVTGESLKKFSDKATAIKRIVPILEQIAPPIEEPRPRNTGAGRKSSIHPDSRIYLVELENPKRHGSTARAHYELYRTCGTVGKFREMGGTLADIRWDSERGYIEVTAPDA